MAEAPVMEGVGGGGTTLEDEGKLGGDGGPIFSPPLYKQRYETVLNIARSLHPPPKKVVDMGCAECKLLRLFKKEDYVEQLVGVDLDSVPLRMNAGFVRPLITDYLHPRPHPLHISLLQGSITEPDTRLVNFDLLTCIEVVEHLERPVLDNVPWAIFGSLCPRVVVMTTPNSEYNVLFPGFSGFRHYDHKFEWTRQQFRTWCEDIGEQYKYEVEYAGVGEPPVDRSDVGHCSQLAVFTRTHATMATRKQGAVCLPTPYKVIAEGTHPHQTSVLSTDEKLRQECEYYLHVLLKYQLEEREEDYDQPLYADSEETVLVALEKLLVFPRVKGLCSDVADIRRALQDTVQLDKTGEHAVLCIPQEEPEEESDPSPPGTPETSQTPANSETPVDTDRTAESWD